MIKLLHFEAGGIVILFIYLLFNGSYDLSDQQVSKIPHPKNPKKIDCDGQDIWFLTEENELFHWYPVLETLIFKESDVLDFSIGEGGIVAIIKKDNEVYTRTINANEWERVSYYENFEHKNISVCNILEIYTIDSHNHLIKGYYNMNTDTYGWMCIDCLNNHYYVSCPFRHDVLMDYIYSHLWTIGSENYIYKYIDNGKHIAISESSFKQIKVLRSRYLIGIDMNDNLWKYHYGNWIFVRSNVKSATINYLEEIYVIDNDNLVFRIKNEKSKAFYDFSNQQVSKIPHPKNPKKIDSYGRDIWFLTEENELLHWYPVLESLIFKESDVLDFSIGADGTVAIIKKDNEVYIRTIHANKWERISYGNYEHKNISVYDYYTIYTIDSRNHLIKASYDLMSSTYNWNCECNKKYYQISCPLEMGDEDNFNSIWIIDSKNYICKNSFNKYIAISESPFKQIKVLNDQYIIGIDINNNLWKYRDGDWVLVKSNVKSATLNYLGEIYFIDNDNLVFRIKK
ncbi:unnamed protein product [Rhizophagus irregularis]|nr:unnamed protein product [Rhizophagus irregularis]CAB5178048.1 unnamed protein product [Rhizophagus irregularis]